MKQCSNYDSYFGGHRLSMSYSAKKKREKKKARSSSAEDFSDAKTAI